MLAVKITTPYHSTSQIGNQVQLKVLICLALRGNLCTVLQLEYALYKLPIIAKVILLLRSSYLVPEEIKRLYLYIRNRIIALII